MKPVRSAVVAGLTALALAGCSSSGGSSSGGSSAGGSAESSGTGSGGSNSLSIYAAASLTEAFNTLKLQFEKAHPGANVTITYGASSDLSTQIVQGAPADVFASASTKNMNTVVSAGEATGATLFVSNVAEIAVPPSNPGKITSLGDLANKGVKVAVCASAVPCGVTAAKVFSNAKINVTPAANEKDVKSTLAVVESGEVDAGIVYVTDVRAAGSKVKGIAIPDDVNADTDYPIAVTKHGGSNDLAAAWKSFVLSTTGSKVLSADGFRLK